MMMKYHIEQKACTLRNCLRMREMLVQLIGESLWTAEQAFQQVILQVLQVVQPMQEILRMLVQLVRRLTLGKRLQVRTQLICTLMQTTIFKQSLVMW